MLIEIRIGPGKRKLSASISNVQRECRIPLSKIHKVPHITLYGGFIADNSQIRKVKGVIEAIGRKYSYLPYCIDGFRWIQGDKGKVIYFNIIPSEEFKNVREELASKLLHVVPSTKSFDEEENFIFHSTLAYKLTDTEFDRIWPYISNSHTLLQTMKRIFTKSENHTMHYFYLPMYALRITLLNNEAKIICEYDLMQKKLLPRQGALDAQEWEETLRLFRLQKGMENCSDNKKSIYLISDLHLDHANIIHYCARPFSSSNVEEMNTVLIDNWNNTVRNNHVYFLGDLSYGRGHRPAEYWLTKLSGDIHYIRGNHGHESTIKKSKEYETLEVGKYRFLTVHDPEDLPIKWDGWIIHGHKHNNDVKNYPFINGVQKTINVCAELTNYKPVSLDYLVSLNLDSIKRMDTIDAKPERK